MWSIFVLILICVSAPSLVDGLRKGEYGTKATFYPSTWLNYPRLMVVRSLPDMDEFTLCFWVKITDAVKRSHFIFSYAVGKNIDSNEIVAYIDLTSSDPQIKIFVAGKLGFMTCPAFSIGTWHKVCITWRSLDGRVGFFVDTDLCCDEVKGVAMGKSVRSGGVVVLGQEQDKVGGKFSPHQSLIGDLMQLHFWNTCLNNDQIQRTSSCLSRACNSSPCCYKDEEIKGTIIDWFHTEFRAYDGVSLSSSTVCK
ncbi:C-reactive protein 1.1-like [Limulus polyphemus]|uniref:C-reactive protein 1.1-like n=1 Tax=Limulus polyphemus TaxID=6850 RepID=A0ABM1B7I9_LIMPO|nr:C-reactive protein 1.1-like [Limulus polyphemus]